MALTTRSSQIHLGVKSVGPFGLQVPLMIYNYEIISTNLSLSSVGNGGSTLYALQQLNDTYGEALSTLRVLLIHAGLNLLSYCAATTLSQYY